MLGPAVKVLEISDVGMYGVDEIIAGEDTFPIGIQWIREGGRFGDTLHIDNQDLFVDGIYSVYI